MTYKNQIFVEISVCHDNAPQYIIDGSYVSVSNFLCNDFVPNWISLILLNVSLLYSFIVRLKSDYLMWIWEACKAWSLSWKFKCLICHNQKFHTNFNFSGELERILRSDDDHRAHLSFEEITTVKRNLQTNSGIEVDNELIRETWHPVYRRHFLLKALGRCYDCRRGFFMYSKGIENDVSSVLPTLAVFLKYVIW